MIEHKRTQYGVRLSYRPFSERKLAGMLIEAEVHRPKGRRGPEVRVWFSGVPLNARLRPVHARTFLIALEAVRREAKDIAKLMRVRARSRPV